MDRPTDLYPDARPAVSPQAIPTPATALTIGAHPDDAEFGAGGTLARWTAEGCTATMLVVTNGDKGTWDPKLDQEQLVRIRRDEQERAAAVLGVSEVILLGHPDGELQYSLRLREELALWIRRLRPQIVLTHDPWKRYMLHPDHRVTGWAVTDGVVAARDHLFFPHQLTDEVDKHRPDWIFYWAAEEPDHWEDIAATFDRKVKALLCHSSQGASTMGGADEGDEAAGAFEKRMREWAAGQGAAAGLDLAEAFKVVAP